MTPQSECVHNRGREGLSPSPPSEPYGRFSRIRLSSRWFPHRGCRCRAEPRGRRAAQTQPRGKPLNAVTSAGTIGIGSTGDSIEWVAPALSPFGHLSGLSIRLSGLRPSTFLPCLPSDRFCCPALRGTCSPLRYYAGSDSCRLAIPRQVSPLTPLCLPDIPPPIAPCPPAVAFTVTPSAAGRLLLAQAPGFARAQKARQDSTPKRVRHPTGYPFASGCSPPRLTTTQLPSATCSVTST